MQGSIAITSGDIVANRLKEARLAAGISTRTVAEELAKKWPEVAISHATVAKYEKAKGSPPVKLLTALSSLYERPLDWFLQRSEPLQNVRYRCLSSRVLVREKHQFETQAQHWLEAYKKLEERLGKHLNAVKKFDAKQLALGPEALANAIRSEWQFKPRDPIHSVVEIMESYGLRVLELKTEFKIDGVAARFGQEYAVVLNPASANDRGRMNAAHEIWHVANGDCDGNKKTTRAMEDNAFEFASCLLIPRSELAAAFEGRSALKLVNAKKHFGISMAAMIYRAEKAKIIDSRTAKKLWVQFARRGWRSNEPGEVRPDRAIRMEFLLDQAISERALKWSEAATLMSVSRDELKERMELAIHSPTTQQEETEQEGGSVVSLRLHVDEA